MREIKFRGKTFEGEWIYGTYLFRKVYDEYDELVDSHSIFDYSSGYEVIPETVGQYTGLKDKNGVEIYFDDIVLNGKKKYQVHWCPLLCEIQLFDGDDGYFKITDFALIELEVIGNIYENKELLK